MNALVVCDTFQFFHSLASCQAAPHHTTPHPSTPSLIIFLWPHATVCFYSLLVSHIIANPNFLYFHRWSLRCPESPTTASLRSKASGKFPSLPHSTPHLSIALCFLLPCLCRSFPALGSGAFSNESFKMVSGSKSSMWAQAVRRIWLCSWGCEALGDTAGSVCVSLRAWAPQIKPFIRHGNELMERPIRPWGKSTIS